MPNYVPLTKIHELRKPSSPSPDNSKKKPRLFVQGIPVGTSEAEIEALFEEIGPTNSISVIPPKKDGQRTTYGFISYDSIDDAQLAIESFDEYEYHSSVFKVTFSKETQKEFGIEMEEDDEDEYYDKLYEDISYSPPDENNLLAAAVNNNCDVSNIAVQDAPKCEDGIHKTNKPLCPDAVRGMMFTDIPVKPFPDELVFDICTTEIVSPLSFYGQLVTPDTLASLHELSNQLNEYKTYEKYMTPFSPKINEICVAKFEEDQEWYRAAILSYSDEKTAKVFFVDYGNKGDVFIESVRCINERLLNFPRYAMNFSLAGIDDVSSEMKDLMISLLLNKPATVTCVSLEGDTMKCNVDSDGGVQLTAALSALPQTKYPDSKVMLVNLPPQVINSSTEFEAEVISVNSLSDISCWIGADLLTVKGRVDQLTKKLTQRMTLRNEKYTPVVGEVCSGFHEEYQEWHRVHILEIHPDETVTARLIDYGNELEINFQYLAPLPDNSFFMAAQAATISLGCVFENCDECALNLVKQKLERKQVVCTVDKYTDRYVVARVLTTEGEDVLSSLVKRDCSDSSNPENYKHYRSTDIPKCIIAEDIFDIVVTRAESPSLFYGQLAEADSMDATAKLSEDLAELIKSQVASVGFRPNIDEIYAGFHSGYEEWYRILVEEVNDDFASVLLLDYGEGAQISYRNIRPLPFEASSFPVQATAFSLHGYSRLTPESTAEFIKAVQLKKIRVEKVSELNCVLQVRVFTGVEQVDLLANLLTKLTIQKVNSPKQFTQEPPDSAVMCTPTNDVHSKKEISSEIDPYTGLPAIVVPDQCAVLITYVESSSLIYGQVFNENIAEKDFEVKVEMNDYCSKINGPHSPSVKELCCGIFDEEWSRVYIVDVKEHVANVFFIDYGNYAELTFDRLRPCLDAFLHIPSLAVPFQLHDVNLIADTGENTSILKEKIVNEICAVNVLCRRGTRLTVNILDKVGIDVTQYLVKTECSQLSEISSSDLESSGKSGISKLDAPEKCSKGEKILHDVEMIQEEAVDMIEEEQGDLDETSGVKLVDPNVSCNEKFVLSDLPFDVHPLEAAEMKMDISVLSTNVENLYLTHIVSPSLMYGITTDKTIRSKLEKMESDLTENCCSDSMEEFRLKAGMLCAVDDPQSKWLRAVVTNVRESNCTVFFIDNGKTSTVNHDSVRILEKKFKTMPAQATPIRLMTVRPVYSEETWSVDAIDYFRGMVEGQVVRALPKSREGIITNVKLKLNDNDALVDKLFEASGYAEKYTPVIQNVYETEFMKKEDEADKISVPFADVARVIKLQEAPVAKSFNGIITCVVSPRLFYARIFDDHKLSRVDNMSEALQSLYGQHPENSVPLSKGNLCAVLYKDKQWYRGYIIDFEANNEKYLVWLLDYGIRGFFTGNFLCPLPDDMKQFPAQAFTMQLHHIVPTKINALYPTLAIKKFKNLTLGKVMRIEIKKIHVHISRVVIYEPTSGVDIADILVQDGLATYYFGKQPKHTSVATKTSKVNTKLPKKGFDFTTPKRDSAVKEKRNKQVSRTPDVAITNTRQSEYGTLSGHQNTSHMTKCEKCTSCSCNSRIQNHSIHMNGRRQLYDERLYFNARRDYSGLGMFNDRYDRCDIMGNMGSASDSESQISSNYKPNRQIQYYGNMLPCYSPNSNQSYFGAGYGDYRSQQQDYRLQQQDSLKQQQNNRWQQQDDRWQRQDNRCKQQGYRLQPQGFRSEQQVSSADQFIKDRVMLLSTKNQKNIPSKCPSGTTNIVGLMDSPITNPLKRKKNKNAVRGGGRGRGQGRGR